MNKSAKAEYIDPREHGQRALEISSPAFDDHAIARAEAALETISDAFPKWLNDDIDRLQALRAAADSSNWDPPAWEAVHIAAHDLKGLGATYGYPIVSGIAASLCRLAEAGPCHRQETTALARAHVDALRATVRQGVRADDHPLGRALLGELEAQVRSLDARTR